MPPNTRQQPGLSAHPSLLEEGILLAQRNERDKARPILQRVIHTNPECEEAWLWLAWLADDQEECLRLLTEARLLFPNSARVAEAVCAVQGEPAAKPEPLTPAPKVKQPKAAKRIPLPFKRPQAPPAAPKDPRVRQLPTWRISAVGLLVMALVIVGAALVLSGILRPSSAPVVRAVALPTADGQATATPASAADLWPAAEAAVTSADWNTAISTLEEIRVLTPGDDNARIKLAQAYFERGKIKLAANELESAQTDLDEAIRLDASNLALHDVRRSLTLYLDGVRAYQLQDWPEVVRTLARVAKIGANFRDTATMLAQGYLGVARIQQGEENWYAARKSLDSALAIQPAFPEAEQVMIEVNDAITPPKRIEVSLSTYLVNVYENHQVVRTFPMCSGKKGSPTRTGRFTVLDKIPLALASQWGALQMPWWIGLYYTNDDPVNGIENGFHALPYRADQQVMWANSLGGTCSYGCIVLDTEAANWLYDFVDIGTVVFVID